MLDAKSDTFVVPIGPQHPALKEPARFEFALDGEVVTRASVRFGYVHRGIEKGAESRNWTQAQYLLERVCGICSHSHATAYCNGVEQLAGVTIPPRAQYIRTLFLELERIHSHLLWLGVAAHEAGFDTMFMYSWRDRETVMDLLEGIAGNRVNYSANILGGVKFDITAEQVAAIRKGLAFLAERTKFYLNVVTTDSSFLRRTKNIGALSAAQADELNALGPTARASGVDRDLRADASVLAYQEVPIRVITETAGDLQARFIVRVKELMETYRYIGELLSSMPAGELAVRVPRRIKEGEAVSRIEAPRGELFYFLRSKGGEQPDRVKVRTPSISNFQTVIVTAVGHQLADIPMILAGIDPCFSCNDRTTVLRRRGQSVSTMEWKDLREYGIQHYRKASE